jgi:hypothetical protein
MILIIPVSAMENVSPKASDYFMASSTYLWKVNSTTFEAWFDIDALDGMEELGASSIKIQRSSDRVNWTTMYTYTKELYPHLIAENTVSHSGYVTYTGSPGYYYRAVVTYYAKKGTGTGYSTKYTSSMLL